VFCSATCISRKGFGMERVVGGGGLVHLGAEKSNYF